MNKNIIVFSAIALIGGAVSGHAWAKPAPVAFPINAQEDNEPQVVAYYQDRCAGYAAGQGQAGNAGFIDRCLGHAPEVWPVGTEADDGADE
ncbi:MAG: hypothetical protein ACPGUC_11635 [Gammaproteobacteria bacterium]